MEDDEIIININKKQDSNARKNKATKKIRNNKNIRKAVKKTASKNTVVLDRHKKNNIKSINLIKPKINKKRINIFIILILIIVSLILLLSSGIFNISEIIVNDNQKLSNEQIISLSKIEKGTNMFSISKKKSISNIKENSYIDTVKVKRILPNKIQIIVDERVAKYMLQYADSYVYIDKQGYMLEISNEYLNIPVLTGIKSDISDIKEGNRINSEDLKKMNTVNNIMGVVEINYISNLITKIDISDEKNYTLVLETEGKVVYLGDCSQLNTRILYLKSILEAEEGKNGEIFINVDLNNENVYFREST